VGRAHAAGIGEQRATLAYAWPIGPQAPDDAKLGQALQHQWRPQQPGLQHDSGAASNGDPATIQYLLCSQTTTIEPSHPHKPHPKRGHWAERGLRRGDGGPQVRPEPAAPSESPIQYDFSLDDPVAPPPPPPQRAPPSPKRQAPPSPMRGRSDRRRAAMQALVTGNAQPSFSPSPTSSPNVAPPPPPPPPPQQIVDTEPMVNLTVTSPLSRPTTLAACHRCGMM
jgi:hypothetical protein